MFTLKYIFDIENKKCTELTNLWEFIYIKYYAIIYIALLLLFFIFYPLSLILLQKNNILSILPLIFSIIFVISIFNFLKKTTTNTCSISWEKKLLKMYAIIYVIILTLSIISLIILNLLILKK